MKKGFSLAESLITLAILGTLCAIMMITVAKNKPDKNKIMFKRIFYSIQDSVKILTKDPAKYGEVGTDGFASETYRSSRTPAGREVPVTPEEFFCKSMAEVMVTTGELQCTKIEGDGNEAEDTPNIDINDQLVNFQLTNRVKIKGLNKTFTEFDRNNNIKRHIDICIDVNGDEGPNQGCNRNENSVIKKQDQFRIRIFANGKVSTKDTWRVENELLQSGRSVPTD